MVSNLALFALFVLFFAHRSFAEASIRVDVQVAKDERSVTEGRDVLTYKVVNDRNETLFRGGDLAVFTHGYWCVAPSSYSDTTHTSDPSPVPLVISKQESINGTSAELGKYTGVRIEWTCRLPNGDSTAEIATSFRNFDSSRAVVFDIEFSKPLVLDSYSGDETATLATFPSFVVPSSADNTIGATQDNSYFPPFLPSALSWEGSFVQAVRRLSVGPRGGPTVFYNASDPSFNTVIVASPFVPSNRQSHRNHFNAFTAGNNKDWTGEKDAFSPGLSARLKTVNEGTTQSILLYEGSRGGITATMDEWGQIMQQSSSSSLKNHQPTSTKSPLTKSTNKIKDLTLEKIGYQTDNGAMYCFCRQSNCSDILLQEKEYLDSIGIPIGYLSFQGAGTSSGRGKAAPWCVDKWSADGGQDPNEYPMDTGIFQQALGVPLQLYAPYFCPGSEYSNNDDHSWNFVSSNPGLPGCKGFAFETAGMEDSKQFFDWFLRKGIDQAGMTSFESDFMDQNVNCVNEFVENLYGADGFLTGMADAALDLDIPVQWCYASPNVLLSSLDFPAVTNFRVSFDYCYGHSYEIGESSLLVWAVGAAPSKDTLWTTDNNKTETPGCEWTADHEAVAAELHVVLALMSTGPVGISDAIGMTNATLLHRIISEDGSLLQPSKPITAVDSSFLNDSGLDGYLYGTHGMDLSWIFVSFQLQTPFPVTLRDFWPPLNTKGSSSRRLFYRSFDSSADCVKFEDALESGCVTMVNLDDDSYSQTVFVAPHSSFEDDSPGSDLSPDIVTVWQPCSNGEVVLGELDKYVALSPKRFLMLDCTENGFEAELVGKIGEVVELTFLVPVGNSYTVVKENITIFNDDSSTSFEFRRNKEFESTLIEVE